MIDIYRELTEIMLSQYGLTMREPVASALDKFSNLEGLNPTVAAEIKDNADCIRRDGASNIWNGWFGEGFRNLFFNSMMIFRSETKNDSADEFLELFRITNVGKELREGCYLTLKNLAHIPETPIVEGFIYGEGSVLVYVGNDLPIFRRVDFSTIGLDVFGSESGVGAYNPSTGLYEITVRVLNIINGDEYSQTISIERPLTEDQYITFFDKDQITTKIDPGVIEVEVIGEPNAFIYGVYSKFGMALATKTDTTDERDYDYILEDNNAKILRYKSDFDAVVMPSTLEGKSLTTIGNYSFSNKNMVEVIIPEGVESIE